MAVYRSKYLNEKSIGIIPKNLYRDGNKPFSKTSIEWLEFIAAQTNSKILHAVHGGKKAICDEELGKTYHVDGFCEETKTVYEFYGCVYHGCPLCFDGTSDHPFHSERKMCKVYEVTIEREERLRALGFTVKTIWEHDYRKLRSTDEMIVFSAVGSAVINYFVKQKVMKKLNLSILLLCIRLLIRQRFIQQVMPPLFAKISSIFQTTLA